MKPPGVGLRILIDGTQPPQSESTTQPAIAPAPPLSVPTRPEVVVSPKDSDSEILTRTLAVLALIAADVGLLGWTAQHVFVGQHELSTLEWVACAASVLLAALCGCAAARLAAGRD